MTRRDPRGRFTNKIYTLLPLTILIGFLIFIGWGNVFLAGKIVYQTSERIIVLVDETRPPILKRIAECESSDVHFKRNGEVLRGRIDNDDIGRYQINRRYWGKTAEAMELDLEKEVDNYRFALWLFNNYGARPWSASNKCIYGNRS